MQIRIVSVEINNFRNLSNVKFDMTQKNTSFVGNNRLGKTNILNAILWCLTGYDVVGNSKDLLNVPKLGEKAYQQCAGFLRISDHYPLDNTGIHPESYEVTLKLLKLTNKILQMIKA